MHFLHFTLLISISYALNCFQGTNDQNSIVSCPNIEDSCISALLSTGGSESWNLSQIEGPGTPVFTCGNCSYFQNELNNTVVSGVSCCNFDLCNTIVGTPSPIGSCDSFTTSSACTASNRMLSFFLFSFFLSFFYLPIGSFSLLLVP